MDQVQTVSIYEFFLPSSCQILEFLLCMYRRVHFFSQRHFPLLSPKCPIIISRSVADSLLPIELRIETLIVCVVWCGVVWCWVFCIEHDIKSNLYYIIHMIMTRPVSVKDNYIFVITLYYIHIINFFQSFFLLFLFHGEKVKLI